MLLTTQITRGGGCSIVRVDGELDLTTAGQLGAALGAILAQGQDPVVLDLAGLSFCDSAGLAVLVHTHNQLKAKGLGFVVAGPQSAVERVLTLSGLTQVIPVAVDTAEARALASPG